jgi:hypothetical protein
MIEVKLGHLCSVVLAKDAWPEEFAQLVDAIERDASDKTLCRAMSDWCRERNEELLADGFAYIASKTNLRPYFERYTWRFEGLPAPLAAIPYPDGVDRSTLPGAVVALAVMLRKARSELE